MVRFHRPPLRDRRFWLIQATIATLVVADTILGATVGDEFEFAPIILLAIPVVYAALTFGGQGGVFTGLWSGALVLADLVPWYAGLVSSNSDLAWQPDVTGAVMLVALGSLVGWRVEREKSLRGEVTDFATQLEVAKAVHRREAYLYLLMQHVSDVALVMSAEGVIRYEGPSDERVLGYPKGELIGKDAFQFVHPDDLPAVFEGWQEVVKTPGLAPTIEFRFRHGDGSWRAIEVMANNRLDDPDFVGIIVTARDITARREADAETERIRSEFLGMVGHELRTPVTVIKGLAAVELRRDFDVEEARESFSDILRSANALQELTENVLDMSRIEAGAFSVEPEPVDLRAVVKEAHDTFSRGPRAREVEVSLPDPLLDVQADRRRVVQVLLNLLDNAAKFSPPDAPIVIRADYDEGYATVRVVDRGRGIAPEALPSLFQKFSRIHGASGDPSGSGLGLAICKGIVESHGGRIWAESAGEGAGCTFLFTLPLVEDRAPVEE